MRGLFAEKFTRPRLHGARYYDGASDSYRPIFGPHNTTRIPPFLSLDVRFAKHFARGSGSARSEGEVYLDVQNVTNHSNPEELIYSPKFTQRAYITGLPILPVVGARWSW
jgi:hypothetical protein